MNNKSTLEKTEKTARNFIPWILLATFLLITLGGVFYLYQNSGYKEYRESLSYINGLSDTKKTYEYNRFFGIGEKDNVYGGILAATWRGGGVLVWGVKGLKYFSVGDFFSETNKTKLYLVNSGCAETSREAEKITETKDSSELKKSPFFNRIVDNPFIDLHLHFYKWRRLIHAGNYIQVVTNGTDNKAVSATVILEFAGPKNWVICNVYPSDQ